MNSASRSGTAATTIDAMIIRLSAFGFCSPSFDPIKPTNPCEKIVGIEQVYVGSRNFVPASAEQKSIREERSGIGGYPEALPNSSGIADHFLASPASFFLTRSISTGSDVSVCAFCQAASTCSFFRFA